MLHQDFRADKLFLRKAVRMLWSIRDAFIEDGDQNVVLESLVKLTEVPEQDCIAALDEYLNDEVFN